MRKHLKILARNSVVERNPSAAPSATRRHSQDRVTRAIGRTADRAENPMSRDPRSNHPNRAATAGAPSRYRFHIHVVAACFVKVRRLWANVSGIGSLVPSIRDVRLPWYLSARTILPVCTHSPLQANFNIHVYAHRPTALTPFHPSMAPTAAELLVP